MSGRDFQRVVDLRLNKTIPEEVKQPLLVASVNKARFTARKAYENEQISYPEYKTILDEYNLGMPRPYIPEKERQVVLHPKGFHRTLQGGAYGDANDHDNIIQLSEKNRKKAIARRMVNDASSINEVFKPMYNLDNKLKLKGAVSNATGNNTRMYGSGKGGCKTCKKAGSILDKFGDAWKWAKENPAKAIGIPFGALATFNVLDHLHDEYFANGIKRNNNPVKEQIYLNRNPVKVPKK